MFQDMNNYIKMEKIKDKINPKLLIIKKKISFRGKR